MESIPNIQLSALQMILVSLLSGYIVWFGHPEWAMGIYMSTAAWNHTIMFGPIAHTWIFLAVATMASISYVLKEGGFNLFPPRDQWIVAWMALWWIWILTLIWLLEDPHLRLQLARTFLCYIVAPLPIFLLFAGSVRRAKGFAVAYIITTLVGGYANLRIMEITSAQLLADPTLSEEPMFLGLYNYHWFAYATSISLIFVAAFFRENRSLVMRIVLPICAGACAYFLVVAGSRQSIIGVSLALCVFTWWMLRQHGGTKVSVLLLLGGVSLLALLMLEFAPRLMRAQDASLSEVLLAGFKERGDLWMEGFTIFAGSPVWGTGFKDHYISHNLFVNSLADQGMVGMIFLIGFLVFFFRQLCGVWKERWPKDLALWRMVFVCVALFGFFVSQISGNVMSMFEVYWSTAFLWHLGWTFQKSMLPYPPRDLTLPEGIMTE